MEKNIASSAEAEIGTETVKTILLTPARYKEIVSTLESLQRETEELEARRKEEQERADRIASDWFEFCEAMGVTPDTQEAVAYKLKAKISNAEFDEKIATARAERAEDALKPFAECCNFIDQDIPDSKDTSSWTFQAGDFRRARTALSSTGDTHGN